MDTLEGAGVAHETLTLHVGAGTFLPVKAKDTESHVMHSEWGRIDAATADRLDAARTKGGRIIPVGTTSLRLLESAADETGKIHPFEGDTAIFITRSEEHTSELQSLMRSSYAVFCLKTKNKQKNST